MSRDVFTRLCELQALAEEAKAIAVARDAQILLERVREGRFYVACLGQFKRGKSTVINALLDDELLPSGAVPVTSVVTVVRFGDRRARVRLGASDWIDIRLDDLKEYVTETRNPENHKGVTGVEVFCRSHLLERGLCLVDTPGIGSVFIDNTEETHSFVPHIDAAIVVVGGDPPISGDELELVKNVAKRVCHIVFVLNKADRLSDTERSEAVEFTRAVLSKQVPLEQPSLFEVSALEQLRGAGPDRAWPKFLTKLEELARKGGTELVARAAARGFDSLTERLQRQLTETRATILRPLEETNVRLEHLRSCAREAEQASMELRYLFDAEKQKLARLFDGERARFIINALPEVERQLDTQLAAARMRRGPSLRRYALDQAQDITEPIVHAWLDQERPIAEREFASVTERFVDHANAFLDRLATVGQIPSDAMPAKLVPEIGFRVRSHYHFKWLMTLTTSPLWLWLVDWFRTERSMRTSAREAGLKFAERLLELNANRVIGDFNERTTESRRRVEFALHFTLKETVTTAEHAAARARELQLRGAEAVRDAVAELDSLLKRLAELTGREEFASGELP